MAWISPTVLVAEQKLGKLIAWITIFKSLPARRARYHERVKRRSNEMKSKSLSILAGNPRDSSIFRLFPIQAELSTKKRGYEHNMQAM